MTHYYCALVCRDLAEWLSAALFPGKRSTKQNISYDVQAAELKELLSDLGLSYSKLTHIFRVGGARHLDQYGVDDSVSCNLFELGHDSAMGMLFWPG